MAVETVRHQPKRQVFRSSIFLPDELVDYYASEYLFRLSKEQLKIRDLLECQANGSVALPYSDSRFVRID